MAYIGRQLARGENKLFDDISGSFNGSTTAFNLTVSSVATATATPYQLFVSLGGVMQKPNTDFTTAGNQITFTTAPAAGLSCWIMMQGDTIDNAAVADASITPSKISGSNFAFSGDLRLKDADGSHYVGFASPSTVASNKVWTLPAADGTSGQFLKTNGSAVLSWDTVDTSTLMPLSGGIFSGDVTFDGATAGYDIVWDKSDNALEWADNAKAKFGTGGDLEIFHNASNSVINDAGTGDLLLQVGGTTQATISSTGVVIANNLTVSGTTTTINTQTLDVEDKNIVVGKVSSPSDTTADGGGITLKGASDKTFNWVNATDAWTSSEHIHLIDNKKLFVGGASGTTDGLEIVHNGSNSILNDSGTGTLQLQLGGSTKLEVTSGGINVTGAISVGGSPLASGNTVDLVADGAIAAGKPVIIKSNGKAEQIAAVIEARTSTATSSQAHNDEPDRAAGQYALAYDTTKDRVVLATENKINIANISTGLGTTSLTLGSDYQYDSQGKQPALVFDPDTEDTYLAFRDQSSSNYGKIGGLVISGTGNTTVSCPTGYYTFHSGSTDTIELVYDTSANKIIIVYRDSTTKYYTARVAEVGSNQALTFGSEVSSGVYGDEGKMSAAYDASANRLIMCMADDSDSNKGKYVVGTVSGTAISFTTKASFEPSEVHYVNMAYHAGQQKTLVSFRDGDSSNVLRHTAGTAGSSSVTWGTAFSFPGGYVTGTNTISVDPHTNLIYAALIRPSDQVMYYAYMTLSGTSFSGLGANQQGSINHSTSWENMASTPMGNHARMVVIAYNEDYNRPGLYVYDMGQSGSNKLANGRNFIGFADNAISDGATGTIKLRGNIVGNQSGLTIGTLYEVENAGTLASNWASNSVGLLAIAADKGQIIQNNSM
jgi:hypothetical protein